VKFENILPMKKQRQSHPIASTKRNHSGLPEISPYYGSFVVRIEEEGSSYTPSSIRCCLRRNMTPPVDHCRLQSSHSYEPRSHQGEVFMA
jgi:hypothetical protein